MRLRRALGVGIALLTSGAALLILMFVPMCGTVSKRGAMTRNLSNAKQLATSCKLYAIEHAGRFPVHLSELVPDYVPAESYPHLLYARAVQGDETFTPQFDWLYFGAGFDETHPPHMLIASPQAPYHTARPKRVVIHGDTSGLIMKENDYQSALRQTIGQLRGREQRLKQ